jgi:DNA (cytosine-5)-methyltransferase 1
LNELSLFTGAGGGILGTTLLGWKHRGYVEWDNYCQRVIRQRIIDGILDEAPIFCDVRAFIGEGYAASYTGMVDVITAGFPCQPFSVAGKRKGVDDERNMWPATADVIRIVRPRFVLLENVPGIREYLPVVIRDLRRLGYSVRRPLQLGADDCGAHHRRKRVWIYAVHKINASRSHTDSIGSHRTKVNEHGNIEPIYQQECQPGSVGEVLDDAEGITERTGLCPDEPRRIRRGRPGDGGSSGGRTTEWPVEPDVGRVAHGVASRVDRIKALGNGQVPLCVAVAYRLLSKMA